MAANTTINYTKLADAAADTYTSARDALNRAAANLAVVEGDRRGYQDIITADGHISAPLFNVWFTQGEKDEIAQRASAYYMAADAYKEYVQGTMQYFKDSMAASTALALITEVHRLVHQDSNTGALLRELRDSEEGQELAVYPDFSKMFSFVANFECRANSAKDALLNSASDTLRKAMAPYNRDTVTLMLIRFFERDTDEHGNLVYDNHYFNLRNPPHCTMLKSTTTCAHPNPSPAHTTSNSPEVTTWRHGAASASPSRAPPRTCRNASRTRNTSANNANVTQRPR